MTREKKLETLYVLNLALLVGYFIFKNTWLIWGALGLGVLGLTSEAFLTALTKAWLKLAQVLGYINGTILLTLVYYLVLCPVAYFYRMRNPDALQLRRRKTGSYFKTRNHTYTAKDLENLW